MFFKTLTPRRNVIKSETLTHTAFRTMGNNSSLIDYKKFDLKDKVYTTNHRLFSEYAKKEQKIPLKFSDTKYINKFDITVLPLHNEMFDSFFSRSSTIIKSIVQQNADCMCLAYTQTKKLVNLDMRSIIPGHIFVFNTDEDGEIEDNEMISARPDATRKDESYDVLAIDNPRLKGFSRSMRVIPVKFSSFSDEVYAWAQQAYRDPKYPFVFLSVPFQSDGFTKDFYRKKFNKIHQRSKNGYYALLSYHDPITGHVSENINCIRYVSMLFEEIFGKSFKNKLGVDPTTQYAGSIFVSEICETLGGKNLIQDDELLWPEEKSGPLNI